MKKSMCIILLTTVLCTSLSGCGDNSKQTSKDIQAQQETTILVGNIPCSFPLVPKPYTLNIMATAAMNRDQEDVFVWKKYEEMTGVNVNWTSITKDNRAEATHTALTNGQKLDLILRCKLSNSKLNSYGENGLILDLAKDGMLLKYAPNCWAYLQSHPDTLASVMNPDGTIYALPQVNSGAELRVAQKIYVNKKWLERVNMKLPTTTEEFHKMLMAFKMQDANNNGDKDDEIPLCSEWGAIRAALCGAFGLENRGFHNETVDADPVTGEPRLIAGSPEYKMFLEYLNSMYHDGLFDENIFSITNEQIYTSISSDKVGVFVSTNLALIPDEMIDDWVAIGDALIGPDGNQLWSAVRANFHSTGAAIIPATCSDPTLVLRWLDYFWTDEGTLFYHMGVEGETFVKNKDGTYDYAQALYDDIEKNGISFDEAVSKISPYPGGSNPTVMLAHYLCNDEVAVPVEPAISLFEYGPKEYWPSFTFTKTENDMLDEIQGDLNKYINNMCIDFVTGRRSFEEWNSYLSQLEKLRTPELLKVYQEAVDRFHSLSTVLN